jgi:hypothetical protein
MPRRAFGIVPPAAAVVLAACAPPATSNAPDPEGDVVGWRTELAEDSPTLLDGFRARAEAYGCRTTKLDRVGVVERCPEAAIAMTKEGLRVTVACAGVPFEACHALFERIAASTGTSGE